MTSVLVASCEIPLADAAKARRCVVFAGRVVLPKDTVKLVLVPEAGTDMSKLVPGTM